MCTVCCTSPRNSKYNWYLLLLYRKGDAYQKVRFKHRVGTVVREEHKEELGCTESYVLVE